MAYGVTSFCTKQIVVEEASTKPYVGFENTSDLPSGWEYDIKRWCSPFDLKLPSLPKCLDQTFQGVKESEYFISGVGSTELGDLSLSEFIEQSFDSEKHWIPILRHGTYSRYNTRYFYYGDNSRVQYISPDENISDRNYLLLSGEPNFSSPILAASFQRNVSTREVSYLSILKQKAKFSGVYVDGEEQTTVSDIGKIYWSNVDTNKREFIPIRSSSGNTSLYFNGDYIKSRCIVPESYDELQECELIGASTGLPYQIFYMERFPVLADNTFHLYVADNSTYEEWERVDNWWDVIYATFSTKNKYFLDKDLGLIYFGAATGGGVPAQGAMIYISYRTTLRVEYEEKDFSIDVTGVNADVNPITQSVNQGFVCITHESTESANISLEINKSKIQGTSNPVEYGPIYIGADYGLLKANVTNNIGNPVPNAEVSFSMTPSNIGYLNGAASASATTNSSGNAYTSFQPPSHADGMGFYTTTVRDSVDYPGEREVIVKFAGAALEGLEDEVYLYQILKDDPILGYHTLDELLYSIYCEDPPSWVHNVADYARWKEEIIFEYDLKEWVDPETDGAIIEGRKVVVYQTSGVDNVDANAICPTTGGYGAVMPLRPSVIETISGEPSEPTFVEKGSSSSPSTAYSVWCDGTYIYVADTTSGLKAFTFDGSSFTLKGSIDTPGTAYRVHGYGDYIYLADYDSNTIRAYSFDGSSFTLLDAETVYIDPSNRTPISIWCDGTYIYVGLEDNGLAIYTFNGTAFSFVEAFEYDIPGAISIWGDDSYIYFGINNGLVVTTYSPSNLTIVKYEFSEITHSVNGIWTDDTHIYLICGDQGLLAYDKATLTLQASVNTPGNGYAIWGDDTCVYVADGLEGIIVYTFDEVTFTEIETINTSGYAMALYGDDDYVYLADYNGGIRAYEMTPGSVDEYAGYWRLVYPSGAIPDVGPEYAVGGYWVVSSRIITFRASCWSSFYNTTVYSNTITARLSLPDYMLGIYVNSLNKEIPFGWKIQGDTDNVAAALNAATFITINPSSGPYPIIDLVGSGGTTGDWASTPFRSVGIQFEIEE